MKTVTDGRYCTVALSGAVETVVYPHKYDYAAVCNIGEGNVYVSATDSTVTADGDGVIMIAAGCTGVIRWDSDTLYLKGNSKVQIAAQYNGICPFKGYREEVIIDKACAVCADGVTTPPTYYTRYTVGDSSVTIPSWCSVHAYIPDSVTALPGNFLRSSTAAFVSGAKNCTTAGSMCFANSAVTDLSLPALTTAAANFAYGCTSLVNLDLGGRDSVLTLGGDMSIVAPNMTDDSFLELGRALVDITGGTAITLTFSETAWDRVDEDIQDMFATKGYTISVA